MSEPFLGEIRMVGFNYAPAQWAFCQGQTISIAQNSALFALLGTTFGGNGMTTFNLPDFRGRTPVGMGQGPGTDFIVQGQMAGTPAVTLTSAQMPIHNHTAAFVGSPSAVNTNIPVGTTDTTPIANPSNGGTVYLTAAAASLSGDAVTINGLYSANPPAAGATATLGSGASNVTPQGSVTVGAAGGSQPVPVSQPYLGTNFIIAMEGIFPPHQ